MTPFEIKNLMDFPIEIYSTEFDKQFIEEEEILKWYDLLVNPDLNSEQTLFYDLRKAGQPFWEKIIKSDQKRIKIEETKKQIEAVSLKICQILPDPATQELSEAQKQEK